MLTAIRKTTDDLRICFKDLTFGHFTEDGGRFRAHYWKDGKKLKLFRYQWVWMVANGEIPEGFVVHHKDENPTNDVLNNLELLSNSEHTRHHMQRAKNPNVVLGPDQVSLILSSTDTGADLARKLGVNRSTVNKIRRAVAERGAA